MLDRRRRRGRSDRGRVIARHHRPNSISPPEMSFFGLGRAVTIDLTHANGDTQRTASVKSDRGASEVLPVFTTNETIGGTVHLSPAPGKKIDHLGVKIEVLGQTELYFDRQDGHDFVSLVAELLNPGELQGPLSVPFEFKNVVLPHESYRGINVRVRYFIRVTITRYGLRVSQILTLFADCPE